MTRTQSTLSGACVTALGMALIFLTGACHGHHHHGHGHGDHHHKGTFALSNETGEPAVLETDEPVLVDPGDAAQVELAEGPHDISVSYDDGSTDTYFDVSIERDGTTDLSLGT